MTLSKEDAASALRDINQASQHSRELQGYQYGGPFLIVWGLAWLVAGSLTEFMPPRQAGLVWTTVNIIAVATTIWLIARSQHPSGDRAQGWRIFIGGFALMAYANLSLWVFQPASGHMIEAYIGLTVATGYVLMGLWLGLRYVIAGVVCAALLISGYIFLLENYSIWMGVVAGGTMILCGVWMRRA